jgi:NADH-quinone oxidoreductase subunit A
MEKPDDLQIRGSEGVRQGLGTHAPHPARSGGGRTLGWAAVARSQPGRENEKSSRSVGPAPAGRRELKGEGVNPYVPILVLGAISAGFAMFSIGAGALAGPKRYNRAKLDAYECGIEPTPHAAGGGRFPVKYYLVAMLFIVFDIESVFLIPYAVAFDQLKLFGLVEMVLFIATVFVAYAYVWRRGGLEWD